MTYRFLIERVANKEVNFPEIKSEDTIKSARIIPEDPNALDHLVGETTSGQQRYLQEYIAAMLCPMG